MKWIPDIIKENVDLKQLACKSLTNNHCLISAIEAGHYPMVNIQIESLIKTLEFNP